MRPDVIWVSVFLLVCTGCSSIDQWAQNRVSQDQARAAAKNAPTQTTNTSPLPEPENARLAYIINHPDLDPGISYLLKAGSITTAEAETRQMDLITEELQRTEERERAHRSASTVESNRIATIEQTIPPGQLRQAALQRQIMVGMTRDQVQLAWGKPRQITETSTPSYTTETWLYGDSDTLDFQGGRLTTWHVTRTRQPGRD